jgi:predicted nucleic acid-binding protein
MTTSKMGLLDTNVLVYAADQSSPFHERCKELRDKGLFGAAKLCITPQNLAEFFAVVTHSKRVANPLTQEQALAEIRKYYQSKNLKKIYYGPAAVEIILDMLKRYKVGQQDIFDLQLVASMLANKVTRIYTLNLDHFKIFQEIEVLKP